MIRKNKNYELNNVRSRDQRRGTIVTKDGLRIAIVAGILFTVVAITSLGPYSVKAEECNPCNMDEIVIIVTKPMTTTTSGSGGSSGGAGDDSGSNGGGTSSESPRPRGK